MKLNLIDSSLKVEYSPSSSEKIIHNTPVLYDDSIIISEPEEEYEKVIKISSFDILIMLNSKKSPSLSELKEKDEEDMTILPPPFATTMEIIELDLNSPLLQNKRKEKEKEEKNSMPLNIGM